MARRRSRRRKSSYRDEPEASGLPPQLVVEDLSPRARRLVESGVIDLDAIAGSGDGGRITSGDILHAARVMEMEQSVARIEAVGRTEPAAEVSEPPPAEEVDRDEEPGTDDAEATVPIVAVTPGEDADGAPTEAEESGTSFTAATESAEAFAAAATTADVAPAEIAELPDLDAMVTDGSATAATEASLEPVATTDPWDAYNGVSEGLSESALPGAEQSWGEAEANIAAIAEEAAAKVYGRRTAEPEPEVAPEPSAGDVSADVPDQPTAVVAALSDIEAAVDPEPTSPDPDVVSAPAGDVPEVPVEPEPEPASEPVPVVAETGPVEAEPEPESVPVVAEAAPIEPMPEPEFVPVVAKAATPEPEPVSEPVPVVAEAVPVEPEPAAEEREVPAPAAELEPSEEQQEVMMDFGTLEMVDPESVWAEGAEDFAPWFLAHSRQLGDVLGLQAGLSDARQFTTKSATGVLGRDDSGEDVVVVSSQNAVAEDSDLGRALGMAASSGAATVALVSAKFNEEQLQALSWLNNQTKSGVLWYGIEMRVVRIADSPAAMLFDLVASPPSPPA